jgi:aspartyl-tRNA(Asn)/glutamyl-tRNA(Gln) amidotransferase subunit B
MATHELYEIVVGLEVHAQLLTQSKLFCGDSIAYGSEPNTHVSPITLGHPGTLPKMNKKAVEFAVKMGLACHCDIEKNNYFARKNYFYPDLPKGYQISQHTTPICKGGFVKIKTNSSTSSESEKTIRLNRIHLEEDAGKSLHDVDARLPTRAGTDGNDTVGQEKNTRIDYNRAGTPLIEIVSEPDIRSGEEAYAYLTELRKLVRYLEICDGNMEEGSFRCDVNISVRKKGDSKLGTRVEVKNLNSIRNVKRAIEHEANVLIDLLETDQPIIQQTKSFDAATGTAFPIRDKEDADDYRYFADPDLTPFDLQESFIDSVRKSIPALPEERINRYKAEYQLSDYDAGVLTDEKEFAEYFENVVSYLPSPEGEGQGVRYKGAANWMLGPVKSWLNENNKEINDFPVQPAQMASLIDLVQTNKVSFSAASTKIFSELLNEPGKEPEQIAIEKNLIQQSDAGELEPVVAAVLQQFEAKVSEYKKGKKGLLALFTGEVMKQTKGKADPKIVNSLLLEKLKS